MNIILMLVFTFLLYGGLDQILFLFLLLVGLGEGSCCAISACQFVYKTNVFSVILSSSLDLLKMVLFSELSICDWWIVGFFFDYGG